MKITANSTIRINGRTYARGDTLPWKMIYPFFLVHMGIFGGSGFFIAYFTDVPTLFLYAHGGFACFVYLIFYRVIFGWDTVKWMFINAGLGLFGVIAEVGWLLSAFGRRLGEYPVYVHVIPFLYYVLYTFLIRQAVLDITGARDGGSRQGRIELRYILISLLVYGVIALSRWAG